MLFPLLTRNIFITTAKQFSHIGFKVSIERTGLARKQLGNCHRKEYLFNPKGVSFPLYSIELKHKGDRLFFKLMCMLRLMWSKAINHVACLSQVYNKHLYNCGTRALTMC